MTALVVAGIVGLVTAAIFLGSGPGGGDAAGAQTGPGGFTYQVGEPGAGEPAPPIQLPAASGGSFDLADARGETVLLYFQEGLMCQPCWNQLTEIESHWGRFEQLGIDRIVTITTDPLGALGQKVQLEGITSTVLSDVDKQVSPAYDTLAYGMMGGSHNGHSFVVVGPEGDIVWRADYGGAPDYWMYLPVDALLNDLRAGLNGDSEGA
ncbi:MAG: redoxin domain-containing protein [Actinobacteria bacterium]|nr:redoxin domain-containing protein [Actinomycetota bacterium]